MFLMFMVANKVFSCIFQVGKNKMLLTGSQKNFDGSNIIFSSVKKNSEIMKLEQKNEIFDRLKTFF